MQYIRELGKIERITISDSWNLAANGDDSGDLITYEHRDDKDVNLSFFYRGKPLGQRTSENLLKILTLPSHSLSPEEHLSAETILRDAAELEYFDLDTFCSAEINGQMILLAKGFWKLSNLSSYAAFISSSEDEGTRIDEIYFLAPPEKFERFLPLFQETLNSIQWSNQCNLSTTC